MGCPAAKGKVWEISQNRPPSLREPFSGVQGHQTSKTGSGLVQKSRNNLLNHQGQVSEGFFRAGSELSPLD
jgi:hypothetical protein